MLHDYLSSLPASRQTQFAAIRDAVAGSVSDASDRVSRFVFLPGQNDHPDVDDAAEVFWSAAQQLMLPAPLGDDELPLLYAGYHSMGRITRRRECLGFFLSDRRLIVQDDVAGVFSAARPAVSRALYLDGAPADDTALEIVESASTGYDWSRASSLVDPATAAALLGVLAAAVAAALRMLVATGSTPPARPIETPSSDLTQRVHELGLAEVIRYPDDPAHRKHFAKLAKALPLADGERVRFAVTDSTLAGPYGLVVTDVAIRSKDLMEPPQHTPLAGLDASGAAFDPDGAALRLTAAHAHTVPSHLDDPQKAALLVLLKEYVAGRLS